MTDELWIGLGIAAAGVVSLIVYADTPKKAEPAPYEMTYIRVGGCIMPVPKGSPAEARDTGRLDVVGIK